MLRIRKNQEIPSHLAFLIIIILGFLLSWYTVSTGEKIAKEEKEFIIMKIEERSSVESLK